MEKAPRILQKTLAQTQPSKSPNFHLLAGIFHAGFEHRVGKYPNALGATFGSRKAVRLLQGGHHHDQAGGPVVCRGSSGTERY